MGSDRAAEDLELFLAERGEPLLRTAVLLAGSRDAGEDLLQAALERLLRRWRTIEGDPGRVPAAHPVSPGSRQLAAAAGLANATAVAPAWRRRRRRGRHRRGGPACDKAGKPSVLAAGHDGVDLSQPHLVECAVGPPCSRRVSVTKLPARRFQWLAPTRANLAMLNMPVPASFHQVAPPS
jgi:hypothetical protein